MATQAPTEDFLKSGVFLKAVAWAKGYAKALGQDQLTPSLLAGGLLQVISNGQDGLTDEDQEKVSKLQESWQILASTLRTDVKPVEEEKMPLSDGLKRIIALPPKRISDLISELASSLATPDISGSPVLTAIVSRAAALAEAHSESQISTELFAAGAYVACLGGELDIIPSLAAYLIANRDACDALLRQFKPKAPVSSASSNSPLPLSENLQNSLKTADPESDRLRNAINLGLKTGVQLAAELAVAYHETGHAMVSAILRPSLTVTKITIVPDSGIGADGVTYYDETSIYWERSQTLEAFQANLCVALAGRAAQLIKFGSTQIDAGASSDIESATSTAWRGIAELGLDPEVGPVNLTSLYKAANATSGWLFDLAQKRTQETLRNAAERAENILRANWSAVEQTVSELMERKSMDEATFLSTRSLRTISNMPSSRRAKSKPVSRLIKFAHSPGLLETAEGPVLYRKGDAIVKGDHDEVWPVNRDYLTNYYTPSEGLEFGSDGIYEKASQIVNVLQISESTRIDLQGCKGILTGASGDWIVEYSSGDLAVVSRAQFEKLYELIT